MAEVCKKERFLKLFFAELPAAQAYIVVIAGGGQLQGLQTGLQRDVETAV